MSKEEKEIINKAIEYVKVKKELDEAKEKLRKSSHYDDQDSIRLRIYRTKEKLKELIKEIDLVEALETIASLKEDLDDAHVCVV